MSCEEGEKKKTKNSTGVSVEKLSRVYAPRMDMFGRVCVFGYVSL